MEWNKLNQILTQLLLIAIFLSCLMDMPYGYYQLVRFIGLIGFIWLAYLDNNKKEKPFMIIWASSAILVNPIIKIPMGRTIWNTVDVIWAVILLLAVLRNIRDWRKRITFTFGQEMGYTSGNSHEDEMNER